MARLGFIGMNGISGRLIESLISKGHRVTGYHRTPAEVQRLIDKGLTLTDSPRSVALASEVIFTMTPSLATLLSIAKGPLGLLAGLGSGQVLIDLSTIHPAGSRSLASKVRQRGADMVDVSMSGSMAFAEDEDLCVAVGGRQATFDRIKPLLCDVARRVIYVGSNGLALSMKIAMDLSVAVQLVALSEAVTLAQKGGMTSEAAVTMILQSEAASPVVRDGGRALLGQLDGRSFDVSAIQRELTRALDIGRKLSVPLPTASVTHEFLTAVRGTGAGYNDAVATFLVFLQMAVVRTLGEGAAQ